MWLWLMVTILGCESKDSDDAFDSGAVEPVVSPYAGGWPTNPDKDDIDDPGWDTVASVGAKVPNFIAVDQYGEMVDLYDFAGHGVPIVLDFGTMFCSPCKALAAYLSDGDMSHLEWEREGEPEGSYYPWWSEEYAGLDQFVAEGGVYWITVLLSASEDAGPITQEDCVTWHENYPNPHIPVLADTDNDLVDWLGIGSYPTLNLVNDDMTLGIYSDGGPYEVMRHLGDMLAAQ